MSERERCDACNGEGRVYASYADQMDYKLSACSYCGGSGSSDNVKFYEEVAKLRAAREGRAR